MNTNRTLFIVTVKWKQPKCQSTDECKQKEYYSVINRK